MTAFIGSIIHLIQIVRLRGEKRTKTQARKAKKKLALLEAELKLFVLIIG